MNSHIALCWGSFVFTLGCGVLLSVNLQAQTPNTALREEYRQFALKHPRDPDAGRKLFETNRQLVCTNCHLITGFEKAGPNLDGVADRYSRAELLKHILEPSAYIKPGYEQVTLALKDGRTITGRISRATKIEYRITDAQGTTTRVMMDEVENLKGSVVSMMPENIIAAISREQFADLIAYLGTLHLSDTAGYIGPDQRIPITRLAKPVTFRAVHPPEMKFANPVWVGAIPGLPGQLAVIEHMEGKVWRLDRTTNPPRKALFVDLQDQIAISPNQGVMGMAFHPRYQENGRYWVKHEVQEEGQVKTTIVERRASVDRLSDSGTPSRRLLEQSQPAFNHNGGCIAFGPDGMLYAAFGDGGPQKDPPGYSQNPRIFHGSMLRLDIEREEDGKPYAIPPDNPFLDQYRDDPAISPETWAIGFREPWRFTFDSKTGDLWLGDVGQDTYEEVCIVRRGENHGWNVYEAFTPFSEEYRRPGETYTFPVFAYSHGIGFSVTGGYVYRGAANPSYDGVYIFGDFQTNKLWGLRRVDNKVQVVRELGEAPEHIASFGLDDQGEILFVSYEGAVYHVDLTGTRFE